MLPISLDEISFENLVKKMKEHREPQPSVIVRRFQFNTRKQQAGETVAEYVAALRKAEEFSDYGDSLSEGSTNSRNGPDRTKFTHYFTERTGQ